MKIDHAITEFVERYDPAAMESIDRISNELGLMANRSTIKVVNLTEGFNEFKDYITGYSEYKIQNVGCDKASSQSKICEAFGRFMDGGLFKEAAIEYRELPKFVRSYTEGIDMLLQTIPELKRNMMDAGVVTEEVGALNDFTDQFMDKLNEAFHGCMDHILRASGYKTNQALIKSPKSYRNRTVFV